MCVANGNNIIGNIVRYTTFVVWTKTLKKIVQTSFAQPVTPDFRIAFGIVSAIRCQLLNGLAGMIIQMPPIAAFF